MNPYPCLYESLSLFFHKVIEKDQERNKISSSSSTIGSIFVDCSEIMNSLEKVLLYVR